MEKKQKQLKFRHRKKYDLIFWYEKISVCYIGETGLTRKMCEFACRVGSKKEGVIETIIIPQEDIKVQKKQEVTVHPTTLVYEHYHYEDGPRGLSYLKLNKKLNIVGM